MSTQALEADDLTARFEQFYKKYYHNEIGHLAQHYPREERSLFVNYGDLYAFDHELAEKFRTHPEQVREFAEEALRLYDLPADISLAGAHVRVHDHPDDRTHYPGHYPRDLDEIAGTHLAIEGQLSRATVKYSKIIEAAFECQRCGTMTYIAQDGSEFQEPHECQGCERQGPFHIDFDQSEFIDAQKLRVAEPPEIAKGGDGAHIDIYVEDDVVEEAEPGDKVVISGILHLEQESENNSKTARFTPYLDGRAIERKEAEFEDIEITQEDEEKIEEIAANGLPDDDRDVFELAVDSIAPGVVEEDDPKLAMFLQLVSGVRTVMPDGTVERGDIHQLFIGDPSTAKSQLMDAAEEIAPRAVSVSGHGASASGLTAAAVRDDFGGEQWTLEAGALVHAHKGLACIDELDKIDPDALNSMHKALAQQRVPINKAGINTTLPSETAVLAAANPSDGRWNEYAATHDQIDIDSALLSRFGLIWMFVDEPDRERDTEISDTVLMSKDVAKRMKRSDTSVSEEEKAAVTPPLPAEFLRKYIAYTRKNYEPSFRDEDVRQKMRDGFVSLRGANGYDEGEAIPVTMRKLQDVHRLAEASARARLSAVIEEEDVERAQELIGTSLREFGVNEEGQLDADTVETGVSKPQKERIEGLRDLIVELQPDSGPLMMGTLVNEAEDQMGLSKEVTRNTVEKMLQKGEIYEPSGKGTVRAWQ
ncbi:AAA family ATPase [Halobellus sp. Atlit-31R]|nr:AAA family ATPase [Halobellus sp. Atlit-31R]